MRASSYPSSSAVTTWPWVCVRSCSVEIAIGSPFRVIADSLTRMRGRGNRVPDPTPTCLGMQGVAPSAQEFERPFKGAAARASRPSRRRVGRMASQTRVVFDLEKIDRLIAREEAALEPKHRASIEYRAVAERFVAG